MKKFLTMILVPILLISCASTGMEVEGSAEGEERIESMLIEDLDDIRTTIPVGGRLCTLRLSVVTGEKFAMVAEGKRYRTYQLTELPVGKDGKRRLYSTAGNMNIVIDGCRIYISIDTDWTETYIERDYLSPFIFLTHA